MAKKKLIIGKPVEPMLASESGNSEERYEDILKRHNGESYVQIKSDGHRIQVHNNGRLSFFTRALNELNPNLYPDVLPQLKNLPKGIFDGELVGLEDGIKGFNAVKNRKRQTLDLKLVKQYPLQIKFFDILNLNGEDVIDKPMKERRRILENTVKNVSSQWEINDFYDLKQKFLEVTDELGLEGLVCKNPDSSYLIGKKTKDWMKLKKFLTLDLVILGVYQGKGKAAELPFASLLIGTKNNNHYETITKIGISNKELIEKIERKIKSGYMTEAPENVIISSVISKRSYARKKPLYYVRPENSAVLEIKAMNITNSKNWHSCGLKDGKAYSLRIASIERYRDDKLLKDINTTKQISELYVE